MLGTPSAHDADLHRHQNTALQTWCADEERVGDESEEDEFDEAGGVDPEGSDSDADMEALLANAVKLAGKKSKQRRVRCT